MTDITSVKITSGANIFLQDGTGIVSVFDTRFVCKGTWENNPLKGIRYVIDFDGEYNSLTPPYWPCILVGYDKSSGTGTFNYVGGDDERDTHELR